MAQFPWVPTSKSNIERLSKLKKREAQIILNAPYDTGSSDKFKTLGWPTIQKDIAIIRQYLHMRRLIASYLHIYLNC